MCLLLYYRLWQQGQTGSGSNHKNQIIASSQTITNINDLSAENRDKAGEANISLLLFSIFSCFCLSTVPHRGEVRGVLWHTKHFVYPPYIISISISRHIINRSKPFPHPHIQVRKLGSYAHTVHSHSSLCGRLRKQKQAADLCLSR